MKNASEEVTLTSVGRAVQATGDFASWLYGTPRLLRHIGVATLVAATVLTGSTGHTTRLNPLASQTGYGSVLDQAAAANVAAEVADQTQLPVAPEVDSSAKTLNSQVSMPTAGDGTLASPDVVNTAGVTARGITSYTVQDGDTLQNLATQFNITTDTIRWANNLSASGDLTPGQKLTIPPISGVVYTVQSGDTADSIASHFQANADQIVAFNDGTLQAGQTIVVPDGVMPQAAVPASAPAAAPAVRTASVAAPVGDFGGSGYAFGYCTYYVATRRAIPGWWGNAVDWYYNAQISGFSVGSVPRPGAIAWSGMGYYGHVAYVESVSGGEVTISEMNWNGGWDHVDHRTVPASTFRYIY